jgi:CRISPR-associated endonuclease/helicase Cas3
MHDSSPLSARIPPREFDVPVLCMTASLPPNRLKQLHGGPLEIFPPEPASFPDFLRKHRRPIHDPPLYQRSPPKRKQQTPWAEARKSSWVVNTVKRCQTLAEELSSMVPEARIICLPQPLPPVKTGRRGTKN